MKHDIGNLKIWFIPVIVLLTAGGCLLSGTFTVDEKFSFTVEDQYYFHAADVTDEDDWKEHKDNIDYVDMVGFELWMTNQGSTAASFSIYVDDFGEPQWNSAAEIQGNCVKVFGELTVAAGPGTQTHITYGESMAYFRNVAEIRRLAKEGQFHVYGLSTAAPGTEFTIDSARVIVSFTVSAH